MTKTKIEKIADIDTEIQQLKERQKTLRQQHNKQERTKRTNRLCSRAGLLEKMLPDTIPLSEEQFKTFLEKTVANDFGRRMLANMTAQNAVKAAPKSAGMAAQGTAPAADKSPQQLQLDGTGAGENEGKTARVSG